MTAGSEWWREYVARLEDNLTQRGAATPDALCRNHPAERAGADLPRNRLRAGIVARQRSVSARVRSEREFDSTLLYYVVIQHRHAARFARPCTQCYRMEAT